VKTRPLTAAMMAVATAVLLAPLAPGCTEAEPPPMAAEDLAAVQEKQKEIHRREYGPPPKPAAKRR